MKLRQELAGKNDTIDMLKQKQLQIISDNDDELAKVIFVKLILRLIHIYNLCIELLLHLCFRDNLILFNTAKYKNRRT